jgi:hypothetical protein
MSRSSTLDDIGNLNAPPGTREWAVAVRLDIQTTLNDVQGDADHLDVMTKLIRDHKGYRHLADRRGRPYATYQAFCLEKQPYGLGYRIEDIERIVGERKERTIVERAQAPLRLLDDRGPATAEEKASICANGTNSPPANRGSNNAEYLTARIARDHPEILERMKAGEFPSVRKAALEAGIVRPTIALPLEPEAAVRLIVKHFKGEALDTLIHGLANWAGIPLHDKAEHDPR